MVTDRYEEQQREQLKRVMAAADITIGELWVRYFSFSGSADEFEVEGYVQGLISLSPTQRDLLALAAADLMDEAD